MELSFKYGRRRLHKLSVSKFRSDYVPHGRCFYHSAPGTSKPLQFGRELRDGFIKSIRCVNGTNKNLKNPSFTLTMNIDTIFRKSYKRFLRGKKSPFFIEQRLDKTVSEILRMNSYQDVVRQKGLTQNQTDLLRGQLRDLRVKALHTGRIFTITNVSDKPATKEMFASKNGASTSVAAYFADIGQPLQFPELPCVRDEHKHFLPMEKCWVLPNQKVELKKLTADPNVSSIIIKESAVAPDIRMRDILKKSDEISGQNDEFLARMNIERDKQMMRLQGRVLQPPALKFGNKNVQVNQGGWQLRGTRLFDPAVVKSFVVICLDRNMKFEPLKEFIDGLIKKAQDMGMKIPSNYPQIVSIKADEVLSYIDEHKRLNDIKLAICILDSRASSRQRGDIKYHEKDTEVVTQCLNAQTIQKSQRNRGGNDMMFENIVLKLNAKCGGLNNDVVRDNVTTEWFNNRTMFLGMDVNHPPPLSKKEIAMGCVPKKPSVVGAVANAGVHVHAYFMQAKTQDARREAITSANMQEIMRRFLTKFAENKGNLPERIVLYRDGVSESQFAMVEAVFFSGTPISGAANGSLTPLEQKVLLARSSIGEKIQISDNGTILEISFTKTWDVDHDSSSVLNEETLAIKNSFARLRPGYNPKLTVITVQKRHHTRFFREELMSKNTRLHNAKNAEKNIPAGTVVDTGPVGAFQFDFFMASHAGIQGCTKASNYVVLLDENKFSADDLQSLTYALCHVYQRSTKSVSLPAPCYFAHHAATRGKELSEGYLNISDDASSGVSSLSSGSDRRQNLDFDDINKHMTYSDEFGNRALFL
uniref:Uncharacterized protein n=1 Tax=Romanomermis culicivorax TaxID=13658 RepID=A0A915JMM4_ROMCU